MKIGNGMNPGCAGDPIPVNDPARRRERRRSADVRSAVLASAARLFARHGFARTSTRDIAEDARVAETAVYRHYGSKPDLFRAAVVEPFAHFADHYADHWWPRMREKSSNEEILRTFIDDLYGALDSNRDAVVALLVSQGDPTIQDLCEEGHRHLNQLFDSLQSLASTWSASSDGMAPHFTDPQTTRYIVGMLVLITAFNTWFVAGPPIPGESRSAETHLIDLMAAMVIPGLVPPHGRPG